MLTRIWGLLSHCLIYLGILVLQPGHLLSVAAASFVPQQHQPKRTGTGFRRTGLLVLQSIPLYTTSNGENGDSKLPHGFNPFSYKSDRSNAATSYLGTKISLRKTTMTELVNELINTDASDEEMRPILHQYKEFLLEPLEDAEAVSDQDSIYTSSMNREERYRAYQASMEERIETAKNSKVKNVLTAMKDYLLSFEHGHEN